MDLKTFNSPEEEARYWKALYIKTQGENEDLKKEAVEFEEQSKTLEAELEMLLKEEEQKCKDLSATNIRLKSELDILKDRLETQTRNENLQHNELSSELSIFKKQCDDLRNYVRELEQKNDDYERANRAAAVSIDDFEAKLNLALEKNVILESELDEKDNLIALVQRMRDETRDLRSELNVRSISTPPQDSNRTSTPATPTTITIPPAKEVASTRPTRLSPLSIVNDLLRKVGALETKLATYKRVEPAKRHKREMIKT